MSILTPETLLLDYFQEPLVRLTHAILKFPIEPHLGVILEETYMYIINSVLEAEVSVPNGIY